MNKINKDKLRNLIGLGKTEQAIKELLIVTAKTDESLHNQVTNLQGQYSELRNEKIAGVLSNNGSNIEHAKIKRSLLDVISLLPDEYPAEPKKNISDISKSTTGSKLIIWVGAIAACLLMVFGGYYFLNSPNLTPKSEQTQTIKDKYKGENDVSTTEQNKEDLDNDKPTRKRKDETKSRESRTLQNINQQDREDSKVTPQTQQVPSPKLNPPLNIVTAPTQTTTNTPTSTPQIDKTPTKVAQPEVQKPINIVIRASHKVAKVLLNGEEKLTPYSQTFEIKNVPEGKAHIQLFDSNNNTIADFKREVDSTTTGFRINSNGHPQSL